VVKAAATMSESAKRGSVMSSALAEFGAQPQNSKPPVSRRSVLSKALAANPTPTPTSMQTPAAPEPTPTGAPLLSQGGGDHVRCTTYSHSPRAAAKAPAVKAKEPDYFESESEDGGYSDEEDSFEDDEELSVGDSFGEADVVTELPKPNPNVDKNKLAAFGDLNKVSEDALVDAKSQMDGAFEVARLRPGDAGYEYNITKTFEAAEEESSWD
jgi:hypothetical protein